MAIIMDIKGSVLSREVNTTVLQPDIELAPS